MKYDVLHNFISPVTGRILSKLDYILVGNEKGIAIPTTDLIDLRLDVIKLRRYVNEIASANFITQKPLKELSNAQALNQLEDGYMYNDGGVVQIDASPKGGNAPVDAKYILQQPNDKLTSAQSISQLSSGLLKGATATGVISIASGGKTPVVNDYVRPIDLQEEVAEIEEEIAGIEASAVAAGGAAGAAAGAASGAISGEAAGFEAAWLPALISVGAAAESSIAAAISTSEASSASDSATSASASATSAAEAAASAEAAALTLDQIAEHADSAYDSSTAALDYANDALLAADSAERSLDELRNTEIELTGAVTAKNKLTEQIETSFTSAEIQALANFTQTGFVVRDSAGDYHGRVLQSGHGIDIDNTSGSLGNPIIKKKFPSIIHGYRSTTYTSDIGLDDHVKFDSIEVEFDSEDNITLDAVSPYTTNIGEDSVGRITLKGGNLYKLTGSMSGSDCETKNDAFITTQWFDADNDIPLGLMSGAACPKANITDAPSAGTIAYLLSSVDTRVELRLMGNNNYNSISGIDNTSVGSVWFTVEQII